MSEPTRYQDTSHSGIYAPAPANQPAPETGLLTVNLKHLPLILGLLFGAGTAGPLGSYMSSDKSGFDKIEVRLASIEKTLRVIQRNNDKSGLIIDRLTEDVKNHLQEENKTHADFEHRLRELEHQFLARKRK